MTMTRRELLKLFGFGTVVAIATPAEAMASLALPQPATTPFLPTGWYSRVFELDGVALCVDSRRFGNAEMIRGLYSHNVSPGYDDLACSIVVRWNNKDIVAIGVERLTIERNDET